ncbi:ribonuclease D [Luteibacter aegosomaticola]|jgi:ribonuclease D|uniref:ribonuclease D n=1 Tax=Luteibacter aegosomaticola TaxID=2911538 RepID=UPI001FF7FFF5|nr:ribonuclease D [Luteibacter aegosomaticola]UPG91988.1 ribonuclease D [Luteibacter aegosomaticola]
MSSSELAPAAPWIERRDDLAAWLAPVKAGDIVGLDTEFMRRNTFYPQLALLQLAHEGRYALIDPLAVPLGEALRPVFAEQPVVTVMHSAGEDLEAMAPFLPDGPHTLFDTQIAAAFVGMGLGISYRALVADLVGAELDKGETRSDWLQRPLTESQKLYATLDVVHLHPVHAILTERLEERGRSAWHAEDCARMKRRASQREGDPQPQRGFKPAADWPRERQALLRRILRWRELTARALDKPRSWLLEDAHALDLAGSLPKDLAKLEEVTRGTRALRSQQREELFALLHRPIDTDEVAATAAIVGHPAGEAKRAINEMRSAVDTLASHLDIPPGLLCSRKTMEEYVMTGGEWPEALEGWRKAVLHDRLAALLPG